MINKHLFAPFLLFLLVAGVLAACTDLTWRNDPAIQAARDACQSQSGIDYNCIEQAAVAAKNPEICRLVEISIDDMCLQMVYEAAQDPTICDRIYLQDVVPNCRAYYAKPTASATLPSETPQPSPSPSPTASPTPSLAQDTSNTKPAQNEISPWPTPEHSIFGAEVTDGPFIFDLRLIQDSKFSQDPSMPWMYSDLPGYGSSMVWVYHGSDIQEEGVMYWGAGTNLNALGGFDQLQEGENGGREGGIVLPNKPKPGDVIDMVLKLVIGGESYGAVLSFTIQFGPNGLEPADISVTGLP